MSEQVDKSKTENGKDEAAEPKDDAKKAAPKAKSESKSTGRAVGLHR